MAVQFAANAADVATKKCAVPRTWMEVPLLQTRSDGVKRNLSESPEVSRGLSPFECHILTTRRSTEVNAVAKTAQFQFLVKVSC